MIGVIAELPIKEGKQADFEAMAKDLIAQIKANEPGCLMYELHRKHGSETDYVMVEKYADEAALAAHGKSDHFKAAQPAFGACLAGRPTITRMDHII